MDQSAISQPLHMGSTCMPMARPRSSCTTRSTKKASGGKWEMAIFLMGLFSEKGSTLQQPLPL